MDLAIFEPEELMLLLPALKSVASANGRFTAAEADLLAGVARMHGQEVDVDALPAMDHEALARRLTDPHRRKRAVQLAIVTALVEGDPSDEGERSVRQLASTLGIDEAGVKVLRNLAGGHLLVSRFDMVRRVRKNILAGQGLPGMLRLALPFVGLGHDRELKERYLALANRAPGTLGRGLYAHLHDNGLSFPGDGVPERVVFHDIGHVLAGYGTDPEGEIQQAAFQAGFIRNDGFVFLLFGILQFHVGLRLTPIAQAQRGLFDVKKVLRAAERGAACTVDFSDGYDFWKHADEQVADLRRAYRIPPV